MSLKLYDTYGCGYTTKDILLGTEYEIESIRSFEEVNKVIANDITIEPDNSLRNSGLEFKTKPCNLEKSLFIFKILFSTLEFKNRNEAFSERTSIHVHLNVADLNKEEAKEFVLLYALLEPVFFKFVDKSRQNNIYCVPLNFTTLPKYYSSDFNTMANFWHKYTAFNILPAKQLGTFEFRHMEATDDFGKYKAWLEAIVSLKEYVKNKQFTMLSYLERKGSIKDLANQVVPSICGTLNEEMFYNVKLDVKLSKGVIL